MLKINNPLTFSQIFIGMLFVLLAFISLWGLGRNTFWHDEAEVALIGKAVLKTGLPVVNHESYFLPISHTDDFYTSSTPHLFRLQTWIPFYLAAVGELMFGLSGFGVRVPFTILGLISWWVYYKVVQQLFPDKQRLQLISLLLLSFSGQFLILIRQARYYAPVMLFSLLAIYYFNTAFLIPLTSSKQKTYAKNQLTSVILFTLSLFGLFHSHYLSFYTTLLSFMVVIMSMVWIKRRNKTSQSLHSPILIRFLWSLFALIALTTPWMIYFRDNGIPLQLSLDVIQRFSANVISLLTKLNRTTPLILLGLGLSALYLKPVHTSLQRNRSFRAILLLTIPIITSILAVSALTAQQIPPSIGPDFRYVLNSYPLLFILIAVGIELLLQKQKLLGSLVLVLIISTNIFSLPLESILPEYYWPFPHSRTQPRSYIGEFVTKELVSGYKGPVSYISNFVRSKIDHSNKIELTTIFASSEGVSLMTELPTAQIDNDHTFAIRHQRPMRPEDLLSYNWVVFRQVCPVECIFPNPAQSQTAQSLLQDHFIEHELLVHDYVVDNREELPYHFFSTPTFTPHVVVYQKK